MALKTYDQYKESLRKMRPNMYKFGELIEDVTVHKATKNTVEGHASIFKAAQDEKTKDLLTTTSHLTGEPISRYLSIIQSADDMINNCKMKRFGFQNTGTCTGGRCVGWTAINSMYAATYDCDKEMGTDYHERLKTWLKDAQERDITLSGALTDPKGDRTKTPSLQDDPDMNLHIVEKRADGIVVRGAKVMICGVAASNEIFVLPGSAYREDDKDYSISFVIPRDVKGLTIVEATHPSDGREGREGFDIPNELGGITQAYLFFEDVFVPNERVFMCGEYKFTKNAIFNFIGAYRSAIGGCVAGQGDIKIGAAILTARANGLSAKVFKDKLSQMYVNNETTYAVGVAASVLGKKHDSGVWQPDLLLANVNKVHVATLPYQTNRLAQDISGGIAETGCMPSAIDFEHEKYGHLVKKYMKAVASGESRARAARLVEWATIGAGVPGCMHGGGSPDGAKLVLSMLSDLESKVEKAKRLAGITEEINEPAKKKR
ncbi:MAG: 4-hydroxyphenylacetate 3-hydroxylase [candidate division Zixibacteria bacterium]|nr:4-hydroxyphenylacetate 3-hydroxylase [candidate division Zixibacteria bacterium]